MKEQATLAPEAGAGGDDGEQSCLEWSWAVRSWTAGLTGAPHNPVPICAGLCAVDQGVSALISAPLNFMP